MRHVVPLVWEAVQRDFSEGKSIDADAHVRHFREIFPDLDDKMLRMIICEAAAAIRGGKQAVPRGP